MPKATLIIISGLSGSGKTTALHVLEDMGFYCVDNLPLPLLPNLVDELHKTPQPVTRIGVGIDARGSAYQLANLEKLLENLDKTAIETRVFFLEANNATLLKRFSETKRKHPMSGPQLSLLEAIQHERQILAPVEQTAEWSLDTTHLNLHQLRDLVKNKLADHAKHQMTLLLMSFGYKHGVPAEADLVFDVRCLPNPYWHPNLRPLTGLDTPVADFLKEQTLSQELLTDLTDYLYKWVPRFQANNVTYMTIAIGCTGGQHRSVYMTEALKNNLENLSSQIQVRHRQLV
jgi:UPF0042 nucleotide-binding protein